MFVRIRLFHQIPRDFLFTYLTLGSETRAPFLSVQHLMTGECGSRTSESVAIHIFGLSSVYILILLPEPASPALGSNYIADM